MRFGQIENQYSACQKESREQLAEYKQIKEDLENAITTQQEEMENYLAEVVRNLAEYRSFLLEALCMKLDVPKTTLPSYEPATKSDVEQYYSINFTNL